MGGGTVVQFKSSELMLVMPLPIALPRPAGEICPSGALIVGTADQMLDMIKQFGNPSETTRETTQQLIAFPCWESDPFNLMALFKEELLPAIETLAKNQRPDIHVTHRTFFLDDAVTKLPDIVRLEGHYVLTAVQLPYSRADIESSSSDWERDWRENRMCQIDLCVTAAGAGEIQDALGEQLGIAVEKTIYDAQQGLRERMEVPKLDLVYTDPNGMRVNVILLPEDAVLNVDHTGVLNINAAPGVDYTKREAQPMPVASSAAAGGVRVSPERPPATERAPSTRDPPNLGRAADTEVPATAKERTTSDAEPPTATRTATGPAAVPAKPVKEKTCDEWSQDQAQFAGEAPLPPDWIRVKSKSSGQVYFYNMNTQASSFEFPEWPLPAGRTKQVSKSTGKAYYFHAEKQLSQFDRPKA